MSSNVVSATLSAVASKVAVPAVSAVPPVAVSPAPTATTYDEQHQLINGMKTGLIVNHVIRLSPLLTTASSSINPSSLPTTASPSIDPSSLPATASSSIDQSSIPTTAGPIIDPASLPSIVSTTRSKLQLSLES